MAEYRYYLIPDAMTRAFTEQFVKQTPTEFFDNIADLKQRYHQLREMPYNNEHTYLDKNYNNDHPKWDFSGEGQAVAKTYEVDAAEIAAYNKTLSAADDNKNGNGCDLRHPPRHGKTDWQVWAGR